MSVFLLQLITNKILLIQPLTQFVKSFIGPQSLADLPCENLNTKVMSIMVPVCNVEQIQEWFRSPHLTHDKKVNSHFWCFPPLYLRQKKFRRYVFPTLSLLPLTIN